MPQKKVKPWESRWEVVESLDSGGQGTAILVMPGGAVAGAAQEAVLDLLHNNKDRERLQSSAMISPGCDKLDAVE